MPTADADATTILMLRHGETEANAAGILQGQSESSLTERGRTQAAQLGAAMKTRLANSHKVANIIYTSDLSRAVDTAQAVADALGSHTLQLDTRFRERRLGPFQGITTRDSATRFPKMWAAFNRGDLDGPRGADLLSSLEPGADDVESAADMAARCMEALEAIATAHEPGATILVVSHGGLVHTSVNCCKGDMNMHVPHIGNVSVTTLVREAPSKWHVQSVGEAVVEARGADTPNVDMAQARPSRLQ